MSIFDSYSIYYDALYQDKDYDAEARYVLDTLKRHAPLEDLLDLGCGTARHLVNMARTGISCVGCDLSPSMLEKGRENCRRYGVDCTLVECDAGALDLKRKFSAVTSLFHVLSYQNGNEAVERFMGTAARHLDRGGVFMFDLWYGPAAFSQRPEKRVKEMRYGDFEIRRVCTPKMDCRRNTITVHYHVEILDKRDGGRSELEETHSMRYFFEPEIEYFAARSGFSVLRAEEWLTGAEPSEDTWGVAFVLKRE